MSSWTCIKDILTLAQHPQYQDVTLVCKNGNISFNSVILASLSPVIRNALSNIKMTDSDEMILILCQDLDITDVGKFLKDILNQTEEISLPKEVFDFLIDLQIEVKNKVNLEDQVKVEALFSNYDSEESKDNYLELQCNALSDEKFNMHLDEFIDEHDPLSESEEGHQESKTSFCKIEPESNDQNIRKISICPECGKTVTPNNLAKHLKSCQSRKANNGKKIVPIVEKTFISCPDCGKKVARTYLPRHLKRNCKGKIPKDNEAPKIKKSFVCEMCSYVTDRRGTLNRHIRLKHYDRSRYKKCEQCKKLFSEAEFKDHTCVMYNCEICGKEFGNQKGLEGHISRMHNRTDEDLCSCETCGKLVRKVGMKYHIESHHTPDKKIPCHFCGKKCRSESQLKQHLKIHTQVKELCTICNKRFGNLKYHNLTMHTRDEDKKYQCQDCGKGFQHELALKDHRMNVHIKSRPYECRYGCTFAYNDKSNRNAHERKTHGKKFDEIGEDDI